jgi:hypothetical protein
MNGLITKARATKKHAVKRSKKGSLRWAFFVGAHAGLQR